MAQKIVKLLFLLLLVLFPLGELGRFQLVNDIAIHVNDIALFLIFFGWIVVNKSKINQIIKAKLFKPLLLFSFIALFSLLLQIYRYTQIEVIVASLYLIRWIGLVMLYFVVKEFDLEFKEKIKYILTLLGAIVVGFGYIQYFLYPDLRNLYYAGWDEHLYRMVSVFLDPNFAGAFFVMYLVFVLGLISQKRFWISQNDKFKTFSLYVILISTFGAIVLTYSRSAYLMLFVSVSIFLFMTISSRFIRTIAISLGFLSLLVLIIFLSKLPQSEGTNLLRTSSTNARFLAAQQAIIIIKDNPIIGVGFNAYRYAQKKYGFIPNNQKKENHAGAGTDDSYLFVIATTGIVGFISYLYVLKSILMVSYLSYRKNNNIIGLVLFCSLIGLFINSFFINSLFYLFILEWIFIQAGVIDCD